MDPMRYLALADLFKVVIDILGPWSLNSGNRAIVAANDQRSPDGCQVPSACSASSVGALWQIACERDKGFVFLQLPMLCLGPQVQLSAPLF